MIRLFGKVGHLTAVAMSGGPDSMAAHHFLWRLRPEVAAIYFNHGTAHGQEAEEFVRQYCKERNISLLVGRISAPRDKSQSWEEYWSAQRYAFFKTLPYQIGTAHHLDDAVETYLWGCLHGRPRFIHYQKPGCPNIIRPFLLTTKAQLLAWCRQHGVPYLLDPSNQDVKYARNRIRQNILPEALKVNPGLAKNVSKLLLANLRERGHSSVGRAPALRAGCQGFESPCLQEQRLMTNPLTEHQAQEIWNILCLHAGANPDQEEQFFYCATNPDSPCEEFRFQGHLGFGGKYWLETNTVTCYPEDVTTETTRILEETNAALKGIV